MRDNKSIAARLVIARKQAGFATAKAAADSLGVEGPTYHAHENGSRGLARSAEHYAKKYKVSLDWLMTGRGDGPRDMITGPEVSDWKNEIKSAVERALSAGEAADHVLQWTLQQIVQYAEDKTAGDAAALWADMPLASKILPAIGRLLDVNTEGNRKAE